LHEGKPKLTANANLPPFIQEKDGKVFMNEYRFNDKTQGYVPIQTELNPETDKGLIEMLKRLEADKSLTWEEKRDRMLQDKKDFKMFSFNFGGNGSKSGRVDTSLIQNEEVLRKQIDRFAELSSNYEKIKALHDHPNATDKDKELYKEYLSTQKNLTSGLGVDWQQLNNILERRGGMTNKEYNAFVKELYGGDNSYTSQQPSQYDTAGLKKALKEYGDETFPQIKNGRMSIDVARQQVMQMYNELLQSVPQNILDQIFNELLKGYGLNFKDMK